MKRHLQPWAIIGLLVLVMAYTYGCASLPETLEQRLYAADRGVTLLIQDAIALRTERVIPDEIWPDIKKGLQDASLVIDDLWDKYKQSPSLVEETLDQVEGVLRSIRKRVASYKGGVLK